jgi:hypothetical protein
MRALMRQTAATYTKLKRARPTGRTQDDRRQDGSVAGGGGHVTGGGVRCGAYLGQFGLIRDCARTLTDGFRPSHSRRGQLALLRSETRDALVLELDSGWRRWRTAAIGRGGWTCEKWVLLMVESERGGGEGARRGIPRITRRLGFLESEGESGREMGLPRIKRQKGGKWAGVQ